MQSEKATIFRKAASTLHDPCHDVQEFYRFATLEMSSPSYRTNSQTTTERRPKYLDHCYEKGGAKRDGRNPQSSESREGREGRGERDPVERLGAGALDLSPHPFDRRKGIGKGEHISTHLVTLPLGGCSVLLGGGGLRKSHFPRGRWAERLAEGGGESGEGESRPGSARGGGGKLSKGVLKKGGVLARLCDPKAFTGTAATGHLPITVDLEGGAGVSEAALGYACLLLLFFSSFSKTEVYPFIYLYYLWYVSIHIYGSKCQTIYPQLHVFYRQYSVVPLLLKPPISITSQRRYRSSSKIFGFVILKASRYHPVFGGSCRTVTQ